MCQWRLEPTNKVCSKQILQILLTLCSTCQSCFTQKYVMKQELDTLYAPESGLRLTIRLILFLQI